MRGDTERNRHPVASRLILVERRFFPNETACTAPVRRPIMTICMPRASTRASGTRAQISTLKPGGRRHRAIKSAQAVSREEAKTSAALNAATALAIKRLPGRRVAGAQLKVGR